MSVGEVYALIAAMALVTYVPRVLPAVLMGRFALGERARRFLELLPYSALAALVFPGVFCVDATRPAAGAACALLAAILAWRGRPIIVCTVAAVSLNCVLYLLV